MTEQRTQAMDDDPEVPFVCSGCTRVFRARLSALPGARLRCGSCGAQRTGDSLLGALPGYLRRMGTRVV